MMTFSERFQVKIIHNGCAQEIVIKNHYLHRQAPCSFAFGLFDKQQLNFFDQPTLVGVIMYGTPSSSPLRRGICGEDESDNVIELTRLWIKDGLPQNVESHLITKTMRKVDKEIIVSFAEPQKGHLGIVYQACSWLYTGLSAKRTDWTVKGINKHGQTIADKYSAEEVRNIFKNKFSLEKRPQKHRYVYFNCGRLRRKELFKKLNYPIMQYPKNNKESFLNSKDSANTDGKANKSND